MTETQFAALLAVLGSFGAAFIATIRWAVNRVTKSMDDSTSERTKHTEELIRVREKVSHIHDWVLRREEREAEIAKMQQGFETREPTGDGLTPMQGVPVAMPTQTSKPYNPLTTPRSTPAIREQPRKGTRNDSDR